MQGCGLFPGELTRFPHATRQLSLSLTSRERLHTAIKTQHINKYIYNGEGKGSPLQYSCLENPRDGGGQWATICGVTESDTTEVT